MKFGEFWKEPAATHTEVVSNLPVVPDGTHVGQIKFVDVREKDRAKCDANPSGTVLLLLVEVSGYQAFFVDVPVHHRARIEAVCRSAGVEPPDPSLEWDERQLKGRTVTVETIHGIAEKTGRDYVRVERWKPGTKPLPAAVRNAPTRSVAKKADAIVKAAGGDDDIPF